MHKKKNQKSKTTYSKNKNVAVKNSNSGAQQSTTSRTAPHFDTAVTPSEENTNVEVAKSGIGDGFQTDQPPREGR